MSNTHILPVPPTAMLKAVHNQMKELFARYAAMAPEETSAKKALFQELQEVFRIHLQIEEVLFYPAVQAMKAELAISTVLKALQARQRVKALLEELKALSAENKSLDGKMDELQHCVLAHLQVEELDIFPYARALPLETLRELSLEMEMLRDRLLKNGYGLE